MNYVFVIASRPRTSMLARRCSEISPLILRRHGRNALVQAVQLSNTSFLATYCRSAIVSYLDHIVRLFDLRHKTHFQRTHKTQIVARLMVEELAFFGIRNVQEVATCLAGYDQTMFPRASEWSFTRFYLPRAVTAGYRLVDDAHFLWEAFESIHNKAGFAPALEIPMESFTRAVEIVLKEGMALDASGARPPATLWQRAVRDSGYVQTRVATSRIVSELPDAA